MDSGLDHATQPRTLAQKPPLWLLVLILGSGTVGITIISPTLKAIAEDFRVEDSLTQWLLSGYFIAVAFSQLVYGPLSDRYGRKAPLLTGLALYVIGGARRGVGPKHGVADRRPCAARAGSGGDHVHRAGDCKRLL